MPDHEASIAGCEDILRTVANYPVFKIINENRNVAGSWDEGIPCKIHSWLPRFLGLGYYYKAWVQCPCMISQNSLHQSLQYTLSNMIILIFENLGTESAWLKEI